MKTSLTPIEIGLRNAIIWRLKDCGFNNKTIARVINTSESTVSRAIDKQPKQRKMVESILFGVDLASPRE